MAIVFFGKRPYGRVMSYRGERAETVFFHIQWLPLIPLRSRWISWDHGSMKHGFDTRLNGPSVAAAYLRWWAPIVALACATTMGAPGAILAGTLIGLSIWSWTWLGRSGPLAKRRSDMDRLAFGHACEPMLLDDAERHRLTGLLSARLARRAGARPPDDVARFGPRDADEAITAYGLLRLSPDPGSHASAELLLSHAFAAPPSDGGPFRTADAAEPRGAVAQAIQAELAAEHQRYQRRRAA